VRGLRVATGDYVLYIDADRQISIQNVLDDYVLYIDADRQIAIQNVSESNYDILSGYRLHRNDKPFRKIISFCLKMTNLIFHRYYIKDANCPYKIYKKTALDILLPQLPKSYIIPIACLEVLARKNQLRVATITTPHYPYEGIRKGFLQGLNIKTVKFCCKAFREIIFI
jgi:glycosyltransferase involved in cell wall biosynthesis